MHQLAPYVGKLKTGMVTVLLTEFTRPTDVVADPFCGSGVVPLEALLLGRRALANDLSDYAYALTAGKLAAPLTVEEALRRAREVLALASCLREVPSRQPPEWVRAFFHPQTLQDILSVFAACDQLGADFVRACMLGILHHVRPGFLSYPASHLTPYLRTKAYPREEYPQLYEYRDVESRLCAKIRRSYRRAPARAWNDSQYFLSQANAASLPWPPECADAIISSPPYFGALDYARDNRLRLWFLGVEDWRQLDRALTSNDRTYLGDMRACVSEMYRILKPGGACVLILGDVTRNGVTRPTAEIVADLAEEATVGGFRLAEIIRDEIPDERRSRRKTRTTVVEKVVILKKAEQRVASSPAPHAHVLRSCGRLLECL